ncbi:MAG: glycoside hydrolase family 16 protein [Glaciecola sp.]|jgi:beta-glucanase (GH16 family)
MRITFLAILATILSFHTSAGWEVSWIDTFEGNRVDWQKWTAQTNANYNNEVQCYTDDDTSSRRNYEVSNGTLKIISRKERINCPGQDGRVRDWTSGRLNSKDKGEFLYGRIETRLRFNELRHGTWPAFWALENRIQEQPIAGDDDNVGWPNRGAGEIDIWEWHGNSGNSYITAFHNTTRYSGSSACGEVAYYNYPGGAQDVLDFHVYAMEWTPDEIVFFINDTQVVRYDMSACGFYEEPMFLLLNVAMGGTLGGAIDPSLTTATLEVDYVAHCQATNSNNQTRCNESTPRMADTDNDGVADSNDSCPATSAGTNVGQDGCELVTEPQLPAPTPTANAADVISLYSDAYNNIDDINYNPNWGQATKVTEVQIDGDNTLLYTNLNYQGTDFEPNKQDVSEYDVLHVDYWTYSATSLNFFLISPGPRETPYSLPIHNGEWQSVDIPLSHYESVVDLTDTFQLKVEGQGKVYIDNIYFAKTASTNNNNTSSGSGTDTGSSSGSGSSGGSSTGSSSGTTGGTTGGTTSGSSSGNNTGTVTNISQDDGSGSASGGANNVWWLLLSFVVMMYRRRGFES